MIRIVSIRKTSLFTVGTIRCSKYWGMINGITIRFKSDGTITLGEAQRARLKRFLQREGYASAVTDLDIKVYFEPLFKMYLTRLFIRRRTGRATLFRLVGDPPRIWRVLREKFSLEVKQKISQKYDNVECFANDDIELAVTL